MHERASGSDCREKNGHSEGVEGNAAGATIDGALALDIIDGAGGSTGAGYQGTPGWVYDAPSSVSVTAMKTVPARVRWRTLCRRGNESLFDL